MVGWNFGSGDTITIGLNGNFGASLIDSIDENEFKQNYDNIMSKETNTATIWFQRNSSKDKFEMDIKLGNGLLYPFVALYSAGDKVTV